MSLVKVLTNVFAGIPAQAKLASPIEWSVDELEVMRDGLRLLRDTRSGWKPGHRDSAGAKLAALSNVANDKLFEASERGLIVPE